MDEVTMLRKEMADLRNEMEREMVENTRLRQNRDEAGGNEILVDKLSGHRVMADPDDFIQESRAWRGKSMGGRGYNQEGEIPTQPQKNGFEPPKFPVEIREEAA